MPKAQNLKILVVDDQQTMRGIARKCLQRLGINQVALAASGDAAMQRLQSDSFDAVISDLNMPGVSGVELAAHVRGQSSLRSIRFFLSTSEMYNAAADDENIDGFVTKPFSVGDLKKAFESVMGPIE